MLYHKGRIWEPPLRRPKSNLDGTPWFGIRSELDRIGVGSDIEIGADRGGIGSDLVVFETQDRNFAPYGKTSDFRLPPLNQKEALAYRTFPYDDVI